MMCDSGGLSLLRGKLGVQVVVDNHSIDDSLAAHGWNVTKRAQRGQGPMNVQSYVSRANKRLLTNMDHLRTLEKWFQCRERRK